MSLTLNKSNAYSMEGILSSCSTLGGLTYVRGTWWPRLEGRADPRNSHESVIVSMVFNAQPARSIDEDLLYVVKEASSKYSPLCISDGDEFTKEGSRRSPPIPNS